MKIKSAKQSRPRVLIVIRAVVIFDDKILLIQRASNDSSDPGKWEIPGGKQDEGQDLAGAAERELIEEVGIVAIPVSPFAYVDSAIASDKKYKGMPYLRISKIYRTNSDKVILSFEHDDYKWVTLTEAFNFELTEFTKKALLVWRNEIERGEHRRD